MTGLAAGLALAVLASVALNGSYLLQHAGSASAVAIDPRRPLRTLASLLRSPLWIVGGALGMAGWGLHLAALSRAPLSLVQAFVAGGLALAAPMAALGLRQRLAAQERSAIALMVAALALLAIGLRAGGEHARFAPVALGAYVAALAAGAGALCAAPAGPRRAAALGLAGGLLYGAADLVIKGLTGIAAHGAGALLTSPWLAVAALATLGAFFAFQRSLQTGRPLTVIALMTAGTNVTSIAGGLVVYGDPLGRTPLLDAVHVVAFVLVIVAAWGLAPVQAQLVEPLAGPRDHPRPDPRPAPAPLP